MASDIKIPVKHKINLMTFFFVPCGPQVESKLYYLAEVYTFYVSRNKPARSIFLAPLPLNPDQQPQILYPLYTIPPHVLAVTEDRGVDASTVTDEAPQATYKAIKRRYERGINSLREPDNIYCWRKSSHRAQEWKQTLATVNESCTWLMNYEAKINEATQSKARGSATASSSSSGEPMLMAQAKWSPGAPTAIPFAVTPPWREQEQPPVPPKARPVTKAGPPVPPPPPPSSRR